MVKRRKRSKKWISWLIILVLLIAAGAVCYLVWDAYFRDVEKIQEDIVEEPENKEINNEVVVEEEEEPVEKEEIALYDGGDPNNSDEITGVITYAGVSGNNLVVRLNIDQFLKSGECVLRIFEFGNEIYSDMARVVDSVSTATCEGFDIPTAAIGPGNFEITVEVTSEGKRGTIRGEASL